MSDMKLFIVEDNEHDVFMIKEGLNELGFKYELKVFTNGKEVVDCLRKIKKHDLIEELPHLILMDINMPIMDGFEALKTIKSDKKLRHIPIIMLTTSARPEDIKNAYSEQSSSYIVKPSDVFELEKVLKVIGDYWNKTVKPPIE